MKVLCPLVRKRANLADLRQVSREIRACKADPCQPLGTWMSGWAHHALNDKSVSLRLNNAAYVEYPFFFWNLKFWHMLGREHPSIKTLGLESPVSPTGRHQCTYVVKTHCWSNKASPVWLHWERLLEECWFCFCMLSSECLPSKSPNLEGSLGIPDQPQIQ